MLGFDSRVARATWTAALVLLFLYLLYRVREAILIVTLAVLFAYLLYPLLDQLDRRLPSKTRTPALLITYAIMLSLISTFAVLIGSVVADQATNLAQKVPEFINQMKQRPTPGPQEIRTWKDQIIGAAQGQLQQHYNELVSVVPRLSLKVLSVSTNLIYLIIIPILSFFILKDGRAIRDSFLDFFDTQRDSVRQTLNDVHTLLLAYMRAQLILCAATFVVFSIVLSAMQVPFAILLAAVAFPLEFIPLVGPLSAALVIIAVSILSGYGHVLWVVIFLGLYRMFQDYVLSPHLMSSGVELHPLLVILGVIAGGEIGGVAGTFLSVPVLALIRLLYHHLSRRRRVRRTPALVSD